MSPASISYHRRRPKISKTRTKTLSGCWTCRDRHVKCDERRPTCQRCAKFGVDCQGYAARFAWVNLTVASDLDMLAETPVVQPAGKKRCVGPTAYRTASTTRFTSQQVASFLSDLEESSHTVLTRTRGPFSVFPALPTAPTAPIVTSTDVRSATGPSDLHIGALVSEDDPPDELEDELDGEQVRGADIPGSSLTLDQPWMGCFSTLSPDQTGQDGSTDPCRRIPFSSLDNFSLCTTGPWPLTEPAPVDSNFNSTTPKAMRSANTRSNDSYLAGPDSCEPLSHHLAVTISADAPDVADWLDEQDGLLALLGRNFSSSRQWQKIQQRQDRSADPPIHRHIDFLQIPASQRELVHHWVMYLGGNMVAVDRIDNPCRTLWMPMALVGINCNSRESNGSIALFHALCSLSAQNLYQLRHQDNHYMSLSLQHNHLALRHTQHCLASISGTGDAALAYAIICHAIKDAVSGGTKQWRSHLAGGLKYHSLVNCDFKDQAITTKIVQSYLFLAGMCNLPVPDTMVSFLDELPADDHFLELNYGITRGLLKILVALNAMSSTKTNLSTNELDTLELQLYLHIPSDLPTGDLDAAGRQRLQHTASFFYVAILIYFRRVFRHVPTNDLQDLVDKALGHIEHILALEQDTLGIVVAWPTLVVAAECHKATQQRKMLEWFKRKQKAGFANLGAMADLVKNLWHRRELSAPGSDLHWQDLVNGPGGCDIIPL
ncbi:hypothetical protein Z517_01894 [Fonsecaea pedrosoi CBS 271.37]|uniref:Zn(2)-C6 fungal-type domain-containing protein n=1 Tax=Fonsecaea pedrosoi CBS 271.37 TaxID=1442368 RepID=A0A0D2E8P8_9EURO|nr:uncharacterized protein Z517_01894 [Fonsecaea pedrosoi CBS 271.37]KIW86496.1 hypothetical protein Z517_01894 [Fonsecaea pedrosoi CBS 271.37]